MTLPHVPTESCGRQAASNQVLDSPTRPGLPKSRQSQWKRRGAGSNPVGIVLKREQAYRLSSKQLRPNEPCGHRGCLSHVSHPCEGCGRIAGVPACLNCGTPLSLIDEDPNGEKHCICARCRAEENHDYDLEPDVVYSRGGTRILADERGPS